ncbi:MAG: GtrA family protein [bacterium]
MKKILSQYYRYIIAGFLVVAIDFVILAFLTDFIHVYYLISACCAYIFASVIHYFISTNYIFDESSIKNKYHEFLIFFGLGAIGLILFEILMYLFTDYLGIYYLASKIIVSGIMFTFNFATRKLILFRN